MRTVAEKARRLGELGDGEYRVVLARLEQPDRTWREIGELLGLEPGTCAVAHSQGLGKLRVALLCRHSHRLGGRAALERACAAAQLTEAEERVFRAIVLEQRSDYRPRGWQTALRGACAKVAPHLSWN